MKLAPAEQLAFPGVPQELFHRAPARPIVRWCGGKSWIVPHLQDGILKRLSVTGGTYYEPFFGGGALALSLGLPRMVLSDACPDLIDLYREVIKFPQAVSRALEGLVRRMGDDEKGYYRVRDDYAPLPGPAAAARTLYLSSLGYNGVWRVNAGGVYNVPYGSPSKADAPRRFPSLGQLRAFAGALKTSQVFCADFQEAIEKAPSGSLIYADPPYWGGFDSYTVDGFSEQDQIELGEALCQAADRGVFVIASNSDCDFIRDIYSWAKIVPVSELRSVGCKTASRKRVGCAIYTNDVNLISSGG